MTANESTPDGGESVSESQSVAITSTYFVEPTETELSVGVKSEGLVHVAMRDDNLRSSIFFEIEEAREFRDRLAGVIEEVEEGGEETG